MLSGGYFYSVFLTFVESKIVKALVANEWQQLTKKPIAKPKKSLKRFLAQLL